MSPEEVQNMEVHVSDEQVVLANGVDICVDTFGDPDNPTVLLIAGMTSSMDWWEPEFCRRLAAAGRFVIRYDHRDTGRSVSYPPGSPGYSADDLVADAAGVLEALQCPSAHVVGISMGGALAQVLALSRPELVDSLTLISTSAGAGDADLPPISPELRDSFDNPPPEPDFTDRDAVVDYIVESCRPYAARSVPFDDEAIRVVAGRAVDRTSSISSSLTNHGLAEGGGFWRHRLGEITAPTVVIHGDEDPLFPLQHGATLAREIHGAALVTLAHTGHELPQRVWDDVLAAITTVSSPNWPQRADLLAANAVAAGEPTAWFERLYASALRGQSAVPWDRDAANPLLTEWTAAKGVNGAGRRAVVVGCGLGMEAEHLAALGFDTVGFDISDSAVSIARSRHPDSPVHYRQADALDQPAEWRRAFDLVVEIYTVQALPLRLRRDIAAAIGGLLAPGGTLIAIQAARENIEEPADGPPWPLHRSEVDDFAVDGVETVRIEAVQSPSPSFGPHWRAEFTRPE
jgi:pimeloyl-ACP methyl ester carboxylesterase